jgi:hypothetical protein
MSMMQKAHPLTVFAIPLQSMSTISIPITKSLPEDKGNIDGLAISFIILKLHVALMRSPLPFKREDKQVGLFTTVCFKF